MIAILRFTLLLCLLALGCAHGPKPGPMSTSGERMPDRRPWWGTYPDLESGGASWVGRSLEELRSSHPGPLSWQRFGHKRRELGRSLPGSGVERITFVTRRASPTQGCAHQVRFWLDRNGVIVKVDPVLIACAD